jgi:hypothetical protein
MATATKAADKLKGKLAKKTGNGKGHSYRLGSSFISKERAIQMGWAKKSDGSPTAKYAKVLEARENMKGKKRRKQRESADLAHVFGTHAGIESPFNLERRSGYKTIWQILAESVGELVPFDILQTAVNERLATEEASSEWYEKKYSSQTDESGEVKQYDTHANAIVINRHPYNTRIEALQQRVVISADGVTLLTDVAEPRENRRVGRRPLSDEERAERDAAKAAEKEANKVAKAKAKADAAKAAAKAEKEAAKAEKEAAKKAKAEQAKAEQAKRDKRNAARRAKRAAAKAQK